MASGFSVQQMKLRAFDLSERTTQLGRRSVAQRLGRLRSRAFLIAQTAVTAGLAWFLAAELLGHPQPFFAPIAAIICLGGTFGHRLRRGVEIALGVAVGIAVAVADQAGDHADGEGDAERHPEPRRQPLRAQRRGERPGAERPEAQHGRRDRQRGVQHPASE